MINFLSSWTKNISLAIMVVSILEMLLPNNKTKKYIKMVMGLYILFSIISPFIKDKDILNLENIDVDSYIDSSEQVTKEEVNQESMDKRLKEIYIEKLESDIKEKVTNKGYVVEECHVDADINDGKSDSKINKIRLVIEKNEDSEENSENNETIEDKLVAEIQKIQKVNINVSTSNSNSQSSDTTDNKDSKITKTDIEIIKKFLVEEYGVSKSCLQIN